MADFHDKYEKCFLRAIALLRQYHIAELINHEHPEFYFDSKPHIERNAKATFRIENKKALEKLVDHLNHQLKRGHEKPQIKPVEEEGNYTLTIVPDQETPKETWMEQTASVVCGLASDIKDFRHKYKP
jgi:hypothetical protein